MDRRTGRRMAMHNAAFFLMRTEYIFILLVYFTLKPRPSSLEPRVLEQPSVVHTLLLGYSAFTQDQPGAVCTTRS